jgi:hypothetical protein
MGRKIMNERNEGVTAVVGLMFAAVALVVLLVV